MTPGDTPFMSSSAISHDLVLNAGSGSLSALALPGGFCSSVHSVAWAFPQSHTENAEALAGIFMPYGQNCDYFNPLPVMSTSSNSDTGSPRVLSPRPHPSDQHLAQYSQPDDTATSPRAKRKPMSTSTQENTSRNSRSKRARHDAQSTNQPKEPENRITEPLSTSPAPPLDLKCPHCEVTYREQSAFAKHMDTHIRPFICVFHYAGCTRTFAKKNEWKRHVLKQHICLEYYHCDYMQCAAATQSSSNCRAKALPAHGRIFRRKDLHMQHVRRMHLSGDSNDRQAQAEMEGLQQRAVRTRCQLPRWMVCPAENCHHVFCGDKAWDERMEHAARHLWAAKEGLEPEVRFGGSHDACLSEWAERPDVDVVRRVPGGWALNNPLQDCDEAARYSPSSSSGEEDAEGEPA
ncbi:uncharacterized protein J7T54_003932 [Emericellopsis cladophorae]|uniref:C2H2-type domain-containing protein n=1 Tax=Emericellopsis cladophorae TaxID=2686198 RepID=A0A9Q0BDA4_9HYPO|nr:uncharacterized protein J7T54_003932 [Emericellopsis cladophorae]KAI6781667.1 hypothetical protein J7T54_003932 [Emericellopsis cladophorae]